MDTLGHVLTNSHVVAECDHVTADRQPAAIVARDSTNDLALLVSGSLVGKPYLAFRSDDAKLGEEVVAAGFPLRGILADGLNITPGVVTALSGVGNDSRFLQTNALIQPGNSGGPLVDRAGTVVGMMAAKLNALKMMEEQGFIPEGVNFAIRHETIRPFLFSNNVSIGSTARSQAPMSVEEAASAVKGSVVPIDCFANPSPQARASP